MVAAVVVEVTLDSPPGGNGAGHAGDMETFPLMVIRFKQPQWAKIGGGVGPVEKVLNLDGVW